jgi:hypothetical protein
MAGRFVTTDVFPPRCLVCALERIRKTFKKQHLPRLSNQLLAPLKLCGLSFPVLREGLPVHFRGAVDFFFFFLAVLGFKLRASSLLGNIT